MAQEIPPKEATAGDLTLAEARGFYPVAPFSLTHHYDF